MTAQAVGALGRPLSVAEVTASTNDDAKRAARDGAPHGAAFIAERQTAGRGRLGRAWHSPPGENLYVSFVLRLGLPAELLPTVTLASGLATSDVVRNLVEPERARGAPGRVAIKWPNDVWIDRRKVAGVLVEASSSGSKIDAVVLGIGINVRATTFPPPLDQTATSIELATGGRVAVDRQTIFLSLCDALHRRLDALVVGGVPSLHPDLVWLDGLKGSLIHIDGLSTSALGIDDAGALRTRDADGKIRCHVAGDVTLASISNAHM